MTAEATTARPELSKKSAVIDEAELKRKVRIAKILFPLSWSGGLAAFAMAWRDLPQFFESVVGWHSVPSVLVGVGAASAGVMMAFLVYWGAMGILSQDFSKRFRVAKQPVKLAFLGLFSAFSIYVSAVSGKEWFDAIRQLFGLHHVTVWEAGLIGTVSGIAVMFFVAWLVSRLSRAYDQVSKAILTRYKVLGEQGQVRSVSTKQGLYIAALALFTISVLFTVIAGMVFHDVLPLWCIGVGLAAVIASACFIGQDNLRQFKCDVLAATGFYDKALVIAKGLDHCLLLAMMIIHSGGEGGVPGRSAQDEAGPLAGSSTAGMVLILEVGVDYPTIAGEASSDGHDHRIKFFQFIVRGIKSLIDRMNGHIQPSDHSPHGERQLPRWVRYAWAGLALTGSFAYVMYSSVEFHNTIAWATAGVMVFIVVAGVLTEGSVMIDGGDALNYAFRPERTLREDIVQRVVKEGQSLEPEPPKCAEDALPMCAR